MLRKLSILLAAGVLSTAFGAYAADEYEGDVGPASHAEMRGQGNASGGARENTVRGQHLGSPASAQYVDRQIELRPGHDDLNVTRGETVLIRSGGQAFAWKFDTLGTPVFALSAIAPKNLDAQGVRVYVEEDPRLLAD